MTEHELGSYKKTC